MTDLPTFAIARRIGPPGSIIETATTQIATVDPVQGPLGLEIIGFDALTTGKFTVPLLGCVNDITNRWITNQTPRPEVEFFDRDDLRVRMIASVHGDFVLAFGATDVSSLLAAIDSLPSFSQVDG